MINSIETAVIIKVIALKALCNSIQLYKFPRNSDVIVVGLQEMLKQLEDDDQLPIPVEIYTTLLLANKKGIGPYAQ